SQPHAAIHADLNGKRKPCLNPRIHEAELWMHPVLIDEQALPVSRHQLELLGLPIVMDVVTPARLDGGQHADQTLADTLLGDDLLGNLFLAVLRRVEKPVRPVQLLCQAQRSILQPLTCLFNMRTKVLQQNAVGSKVVPHAIHVAQRPQRPSKNQPVEPRQHPRDLVPMLRDKLVHGASFLSWMLCLCQLNILREVRSALLLVAATPRCVISVSVVIWCSTKSSRTHSSRR